MRINLFKGITRNIILLGLVSLFTDLSSEMIFPLIPLFVTGVIGCGASVVGIIEGAAETTASLLKVVSGFWSDKIKKRKPFVFFGYSLSAIIKPLFAFATGWAFVLFIRVIERIGKGIRTAPRDAIVAESCDKTVRGKAYGFHRTMDCTGAILGSLLAFLLLPVFGYKNIFLFAFIPAVIGVFVILFIKERNNPSLSLPQGKGEKKEERRLSFRTGLKELPLNLKLFILIASIFALGHFGYAFLLLRAKNIGLTDEKSILFYVIFNVVYAVFSIPFGTLSDKIGRRPVLISGYLIFAVTSFGLIFTTTIYSVLVFFIIYGLFYALVEGVQRAFVVDLAPSHLKGTALGVFHTALGLVSLPGGFIAGLLWDKINPEATFIYGSILSVLAVIMFLFVKANPSS